MNRKHLPDKFIVAIGGYGGDNYSVEMKESTLIYRKNYEEIVLEPDTKDWKEFWGTLEEIDIWKWQRDYNPERPILDGTSWKIDIQYGEKEVLSSGSNAYPPSSETEMSDEFLKFCQAVSDLCGGRKFR